jgi:hypothetical protein
MVRIAISQAAFDVIAKTLASRCPARQKAARRVIVRAPARRE